MPHLVFEYSENLPALDFPSLVLPLHRLLAEEAGARLEDCKSRWREAGEFLIGGGRGESAFLHLSIDLLAGRPRSVLQMIGKRALQALERAVAAQLDDRCDLDEIQVSVEIREMRREGYFKERMDLPLE